MGSSVYFQVGCLVVVHPRLGLTVLVGTIKRNLLHIHHHQRQPPEKFNLEL